MGFKGLSRNCVFVVTTRAGKISRSSTLRFAVFSLASVDFFGVVFYFRIIFSSSLFGLDGWLWDSTSSQLVESLKDELSPYLAILTSILDNNGQYI